MAGKTRIGQLLKQKGATQGEAAKALGISMASFSGKANGRHQFKAGEIKKLAELYDMDATEIHNVFFQE